MKNSTFWPSLKATACVGVASCGDNDTDTGTATDLPDRWQGGAP